MHTKLAGRIHSRKSAILSRISPLTITEDLTSKHPATQDSKAAATETQATAAQLGTVTATGNTDATIFPPQQIPSARLEHEQAEVLTHTPWAGWYYETEPG